ncbi:hypothetical protein ASC89_23565 [Devosia sp. Root413D1]|uniref:3-oxoadipate enol-lactonase n=1 Tax=Devosia sp. Root413D1 TaxID=1736531 RepID=UPI0006F24DDC|nr:3-oxoadipate enol-lactonase [Devosia sp. Root413D1]KQW75900.1 hypothetical protein ASC89_23565 [Devosia sp. Root413D1]
MAFAAASFGTVHYRLSGQPRGLPIVFCNSLGTDIRIWDAVVDELAPDYRLVNYDKRGHGLSSVPPGPYSIAELAADLRELVDTLEIDRFALVGISVGGLIAQRFALDHPRRITGLVLCDTATKIGDAALWSGRIGAIEADGLDAIADSVMQRWFPDALRAGRAAEIEGWRNLLLRTPKAGYLGTCAALRDADLTAEIGDIKQPTLVLAGAADQSTPVELVRAMAERLRAVHFAAIEDAGHLSCIDQPQRVAGLIRDYLLEVGHA